MKSLLVVPIVLFITVHSIRAQTFFDDISEHHWKGKGELLGSVASFKMDWKAILDGKFYQLSFQNQREESKDFIFKAIGVYQLKDDGKITGTWFDSRGLTFPLKGNFSSDTLTVLWGTPETEEGKTVYTFTEKGTVAVTDYVLEDGEFVKFGNADYEPNN